METHMKNLVLRHMPPNLQTMDSKQTSKSHILNQLLLTKCYYLTFIPILTSQFENENFQ